MQTVFRTSEAIAAFGRARVRRELEHGTWRHPVRGVIVTHNGRTTARENAAVALALRPPGTVLGGVTALEFDGFKSPFALTKPHIVLPEGARRPNDPRVIPHWSTKLGPEDVHPTRVPARTRPARSVVDQAAWSSTDRGARVFVLSAAQQGLVRPQDMREALSRRGACRWRAVIVQSILDASGGIQSLPERDFNAILVSRGLPRPIRQARGRRPDGKYYLDNAWPEHDAACEIHGMPHMELPQWDADLDRANDVVVSGPRLVAFSSFAVRHRPDRVGDQVEELLRRGGWRPRPPARRWTRDDA